MARNYQTSLKVRPEVLWRLARQEYGRGHRLRARILKSVIFVMFKAILPPEADVADDVALGHLGLNVVVHPNTSIGPGVLLWHGVTLASDVPTGQGVGPVLGPGVVVGTGAVVVHSAARPVVVGEGAVIGAGAVVVRSVDPHTTVVGNPARVVSGKG